MFFFLSLMIGALEGAFVLIAKSAMAGAWRGWGVPLAAMTAAVTLRTLIQILSARLELDAVFAWLAGQRTRLLGAVKERAFPAYRGPWRNSLVTSLGIGLEDLGQGIGAGFRCLASLAHALVLAPLLFVFSWKLAAGALALAVPAVLASRLRADMLAASGSRWIASKADLAIATEAFADGLESAAGNGGLAEAADRQGKGMSGHSRKTHAWETAKALFPPALEWFFFMALAVLAWTAQTTGASPTGASPTGAIGRGGWEGALDLMPFGALLLLMYRPIREWARNYPLYLLGSRSWESLRSLQVTLEAFPVRCARPASELGNISLAGIRFGYQSDGDAEARPVLDGLDLEIDPGELTWISGRNGAGKSTLLKLLAGIETPESGQIRFPGHWTEPAIAYLPQKPFLATDWAVWAAGYAEVHPREWKALDGILGLERMLERIGAAGGGIAKGLSGGERQRLCLARVFASPAAYLLADEPTTWLTAGDRERILGDLLAFWRRPIAGRARRGAALVSHEPFVGEFCARTVRVEPETMGVRN
ncbi:MAG: ABC transporter ATP-binding protein [Fibrobacteria bacterium]